MAQYGSNNVAFLLVDGYNLLGVTTELEDQLEALLEETTALGDAWATQGYVGLKRYTLRQGGYFDDAADSSNDALVDTIGSSRVLTFGVAGNVKAQPFIGATGAVQVNYTRLASRAAFHRANAEYQSQGIVEDGQIVHALATRTANGNTEAAGDRVDSGAAAPTAFGGAAYLQIPALSLGGYTSLTVKLRHSADGSSWSDLVTFTALTGGSTIPQAQRVTIAAGVDSIKRYLAASWTLAGSGAGPSFTFMVGAVRNAA